MKSKLGSEPNVLNLKRVKALILTNVFKGKIRGISYS